ncbi:MAG TPA: MurR/RpiR family transcriptional regulator, partial [Nordella sp.]|nr:MurR/RpiR family transcriptional regulator [Nordella sp.]
ASRLAQQAEVSDPTVIRLATKLGFSGFIEMQQALLAELEAHMNSALTMLESRKPTVSTEGLYQSYAEATIATLKTSQSDILPADFNEAADLLIKARKRIFCIGGRFTGFLAAILHRHLVQLRPGAIWVNGSLADLAEHVADIGKPDLVVAFDLRRYQQDVVQFCRQAHERGARIILLTDKWKSPIASFATVTLTGPVDTISPFDTMVPTMVQLEALVTAFTGKLDKQVRPRLEEIEHYRRLNGVVLDTPAPAPSKPRKEQRVRS